MDRYSYICNNCGVEYIPTRRRVQKYCNNSCRTRAFMLRKPDSGFNLSISNDTSKSKEQDKVQIDKMSLAGVGNAVAGTALFKIAEALLTSEANKPATKNDLKNLEDKISKRYYPIRNMVKDIHGKSPYFDAVQFSVVYF